MKHPLTLKLSCELLPGLLVSLVLLNLLYNTSAGNSVVLAQSPSAIPRYSDWSTPVSLGPNINSASSERQVSITHRGLSLYFDSDRPGGIGANDIYVSQRTSINAPWGLAKNLGPGINSPQAEFAPNLSADDHWMFFASARLGGFGGLDIWSSYRADIDDDFGWETPKNMGPRINSSVADADAFYFIDSATGKAALYFTSLNRPGGLGDWDIYQSTQNEDASFNQAVLVSELSSRFRDTRMAIRYDGLEIIFSSNHPGGSGGIDLWFSTRLTTSDIWSTPVNLGSVINTSTDDRAPYLSDDGETLFFSSDRLSPFGGGDIWMATRTQLPIVKTRDITVTADNSCGASISPSDVDDGSFDPDSGDTITLSLDQSGPFGLGQRTVTLTATDNHGASSSSTAVVTVVDQMPPTVTAPPAITVATGPGATSCGTFISDVLLGAALASDNCSVTIRRAGVPDGNFFPIGTTTTTYVATDESGNTASAIQEVTVNDNTPPVITGATVDEPTMSPPNHKMVDVAVSYAAIDNCGPASTILSVSSNELVNGPGDGNTASDWEVIDAHHVQLRAERSGKGDGRVYMITIAATDSFGNTSSQLVTVLVPHN